MFAQINPGQVIVDRKFQGLCCSPFYGHPRGCPNFGKKEGCPPQKFLENELLDFSRELFVVYTRFNLSHFAEKMWEKHPDWRAHPRQLCNPRQWQPHTRMLHRQDKAEFLELYPSMHVDSSPEARGVNLTQVMNSVGIELDWNWPPKSVIAKDFSAPAYVYTISLAGYLINSHR